MLIKIYIVNIIVLALYKVLRFCCVISGNALLACPVTDPRVTEVRILLPGSDEVSLHASQCRKQCSIYLSSDACGFVW